MKKSSVVFLVIAIVSGQFLLAADTKPTGPVLKGPKAIALNPETLRQRLLESNLSVTQGLNSVKDGKDQISVARGNLLPSLNLGGMLGSGGTFLLTTVQFLLPFLLPSNWFNYKAAKDGFEADKLAYHILELNTYSSALSLYYTVLADQETQVVYQKSSEDLEMLAKIQDLNAKVGTASQTDVLQTQAQAHMAGVQASNLLELTSQELSSIRMALALPLSTDISFDQSVLAPSIWETKDIQQVIDQALSVSPEHQQIQYLVKVAKNKKWSAVFGFINGATLSAASSKAAGGAMQSVGFSNLNTGASVGLGFALFPQIRIANRNIEEVALMDTELVQSDTQVLESAMKSLKEAKTQFDLASRAEKEMSTVYKLKLKIFGLGMSTLTETLLARHQMTDSMIARIKAQMNLNLQRTVLHRTLLTEEFAKIKGCNLDANNAQKRKQSLDVLCRPEAQPPQTPKNN